MILNLMKMLVKVLLYPKIFIQNLQLLIVKFLQIINLKIVYTNSFHNNAIFKILIIIMFIFHNNKIEMLEYCYMLIIYFIFSLVPND